MAIQHEPSYSIEGWDGLDPWHRMALNYEAMIAFTYGDPIEWWNFRTKQWEPFNRPAEEVFVICYPLRGKHNQP